MHAELLTGRPSLWALAVARAERTPEAAALLDSDDRRLTFGGLVGAAEAAAVALAARGVGPGTPVSWQLPTSIEAVVASLALARLGALQNPIIAAYGERELRSIVADHRPALALVHRAPGASSPLDGLVPDVLDVGEVVDLPEVVDLTEVVDVSSAGGSTSPSAGLDALPDPATLDAAGDEVRWLYHTSGTTSAPKGVRHTDRTLLAGATALAEVLEVRADDVGSIAFPYAHIGGADYLGLVLLAGIPAVLLPAFVVDQALPVFRRHGVTIAGGTTAFYLAFLRAQRGQPGEPILPTLRVLAGGGAPKPAEVFHAVRRELGVPIVHGWAMTECPMACSGRRSDPDDLLAETEGRPVTGLELRVVDPDGRAVADGAEGELLVRGPMLFRGYSDPALDAAAFDADRFFRTGDLGRVRPDGHLVVTGRAKDVIIRKGENISAAEVEDVLHRHLAVDEVAVVGLPDPERGERACAVVVPRRGVAAPDLEALAAHCLAEGLAGYKRPEQLAVVDALPRNPTGKVDRQSLRARLTR